jgi:hypothetical protein
MTDRYRSGQYCGDQAALVGYLYDDCEPGERQAIAAHVSNCPACAGELEALRGARAQLAVWTPPDTRLGFRITSDETESSGVVPFVAPRQAVAWWRQPLPAWAQMAAAFAIFAAGVSIGTARGSAAAPPAAAVSVETRAALRAFDARLSSVERRANVELARVDSALDGTPREDTILKQVRHEITSSEERQRGLWSRDLAIGMLLAEDTRQQQVDEIKTNIGNLRNEMIGTALQLAAYQR